MLEDNRDCEERFLKAVSEAESLREETETKDRFITG